MLQITELYGDNPFEFLRNAYAVLDTLTLLLLTLAQTSMIAMVHVPIGSYE